MNDVQASSSTVHVKPSIATDQAQKPAATGKELPAVEKTVEIKEEVVNSSASVHEQLEQAVSRLNEYVQSTQRDLQFSMDEATGKTVITVIDSNTSEVIRRLPGEVALNLARKLNEEEPIRLFSAQA